MTTTKSRTRETLKSSIFSPGGLANALLREEDTMGLKLLDHPGLCCLST